MSGIKPILMEKPQYFEGAHDDIERFLGDCKTYFEVFHFYYLDHPALKVVLASSLLRGEAQDWWVHLRDEFDYTPEGTGDYDDDDEGRAIQRRYKIPIPRLGRIRPPDPGTIPGSRHRTGTRKRMGELHMTGPAYLFFRKMEREAKLANRLNDQDPGRY